MTPQERDELLIRLDERSERLERWVDAHCALHEKLTLAFIGAVASTVLGLGAMIVTLLR